MTQPKYCKLLFLILLSQIGLFSIALSQPMWSPDHSVGTLNGVYNYPAGSISTQFVEVYSAALPSNTSGLSYQWYSNSSPLGTFTAINGATSSSYSVPSPFTATTYYYRQTNSTTALPLNGVLTSSITSNIIKLSLASVNWEDINYVREHDVLITGQTIWNVIDQLPIGSKYQTTTYLDGLGRSIEKVSKQTATPPSGSNTWGDIVQFYQYDQYGRQPTKYLPYTTNNQPGKYKTAPLTDQPAYYANTATYNETNPYSSITFDNSPLNRVYNVKEPGNSWYNSAGNSAAYDMNTVADNVQIWGVDYVQGDAPVNKGVYAVNTLYKLTYTDVNSNQVVEFTNISGQLILKKVQAVTTPTDVYTGWICTYIVYDDFGLLRFQIQPEGVKWLYANSWNFGATNGASELAEQVFQYNYDDKGRTIWKKAPGASSLNMVYDIRDRVVFMQDGNQAGLTTPQWTANLYDDLDRPVMTTLLNTTEPLSGMQADVANAPAYTSFSVTLVANTSGPAIPLTLSLCPGSLNTTSLNSSSSTVVLKYLFYDNYNFALAKSFNTSYTNLTAYNPASDPSIIPIAQSQRTWSMPTGSLVRVLGSSSTFLGSTNYYDEKGHHIQTLEDNIRSGTDITTLQYYFEGSVLSTSNTHTNTSAGYTSFNTLNKYLFDNIDRVISIQKTIGTNAAFTIASYSYDDIGRMGAKTLSPGYSNITTALSQLETLNYSFNIHNQITGINKNYALKTSGTYNKWGNYFGMDIGYDKTDNVFNTSAKQLNGQVGGIVWNTMGDDAQRKYEYTYDNAGRLVAAAFNQQQHPGDGWGNSAMDFSVNGTSGQITYDLNGNLLTMLQKGVMPGQAAPLIIDDLRYSYTLSNGINGNKLQSVTDQMTTTTFNGSFGDFKDGTNAPGTADYVYDNNGNVVVDLNKNVQNLTGTTNGIHYNYLDKPDQIRIVGKGTILIVYSADGEKLQRAFVPEAGGSSNITTYINQYIYQETSTTLTTSSLPPFSGTTPHLAYMNFEEGRVRAMTPVSTNNGFDQITEAGNITLPAAPTGGYTSGAWDYFIMDYQQNVRMILTEETHFALNDCTMETARASVEDPVFGQTTNNEVEATRFATPSAWTGNGSLQVSRLGNLSGHNLGPNTLQKVMAGDQVNAVVDYYYNSATGGSNSGIVNTVLNNLLALIGNGSATSGTLTHGAASNITAQLNADPNFTSYVAPAGSGGNTPQAYLTILFFDERFKLISAADGGLSQSQVASSVTGAGLQLTLPYVKAPKNGYVYAYISNRSDQDVYFDNFKVSIQTGNIIEENHYYAFGLKIAAISSKKLGDGNEGKLSNPYLYNDKEQIDEDAGLNWYDYGFRNYDSQIGRFMQLDPYADAVPLLSPYQYAFDDPITNIDVDGLFGESIIGTTAETAKTLAAVTVHGVLPTVHKVFTFARLASVVSKVGDVIKVASLVSEIITTGISTNPVIDPHLLMITLQGSADALLSANTLGLSELFGTNLDKFEKPEEKLAYLTGRLAGDAAAATQGRSEIGFGGRLALTTGAETEGVGLAVGAGIAAHGATLIFIASRDVIWVQNNLIALGDVGSIVKYQAPSNKGGKEPNDLGKAGEKATKADQPSLKEHYRGASGKDRIADKATKTTVEETKNVTYQYWSSQLKDAATFAKNTGRKFILWVRKSTKLSKELLRQQKLGNVKIEPIPGSK
jgi:RHS repeat-associated protein